MPTDVDLVSDLRSALQALDSPATHVPNWTPVAALASVSELESRRFRAFMDAVNRFASALNLHAYRKTWSKTWEYPWLWFNGLGRVPLTGRRVLDIGPANRPIPWVLAALGAHVTLVELYGTWLSLWEEIRERYSLPVDWSLVTDDRLPFPDASFDVVTSLSVLEHQTDKMTAVNEMARVLRTGGLCAVSCDVCEEAWGMTFPQHLGRALSPAEFKQLLWSHEAFENNATPLGWRQADCLEFVQWHSRGDSTARYVVGAGCLRRR